MARVPKDKKQKGMAALAITMIVLAIVTVVTIFSARVIVTDNKIYQNQQNSAYAFNAAQAGIDYALAYLNMDLGTVTTGLASCASAASTYALTLGTLPNNATYTMTYGCTATNMDVLSITSVGRSADGTATRTISVLVKTASGAFFSYAVIGGNDDGGTRSIDLQTSATVRNNTAGAKTTMAGGATVRVRANSSTSTATGAPYACAATQTMPPAATSQPNCLDITYSNATLLGLAAGTGSGMETPFIGRAVTDFSALATYRITCTRPGTTNFLAALSTLGATGTATPEGCTCTPAPACDTKTLITASASGGVIYINMTGSTPNLVVKTEHANATFGAVTTPVIFAINNKTGNTTFTANENGDSVTINGNIYTNTNNGTSKTTTVSETGSGATAITLNGILFSTGEVKLLNTATVNGVVVGAQVGINRGMVNYNSTNIGNTHGGYYGSLLTVGLAGGLGYGIVSGSWRDF